MCAQAYYDAALEPLSSVIAPSLVTLKQALPGPLVLTAFVLCDLLVACGFVAYTCCTLLVTAAAVALIATASRKARGGGA